MKWSNDHLPVEITDMLQRSDLTGGFFFNFGFRFQVNFNVLKIFTDLIPSIYMM